MAKKLNFWTQDNDGERWLINGPELLIAANRPKKKGKRKMYTNKPRHGTKAWMSYIRKFRKNAGGKRKKHAKRRQNMYSAGQVANRPRTRTVTRYVKANRKRRHNPGATQSRGMFGLAGFPGIEPITGAFAGLTIPPILDYFVKGYIPTALTSNAFGRYAVKGLEAFVPAWLVRRYVNRNVGNIMMFVGIAKVLFDGVREFAPGIPGLSGGVGYQPMLGVYQQRRGLPALPAVPQMTSAMTSGVPQRLDPARRH